MYHRSPLYPSCSPVCLLLSLSLTGSTPCFGKFRWQGLIMLYSGSIVARTALLCGLSFAILVRSVVNLSSNARAVVCEDGSHATLEHNATIHKGKDTRRWSCKMKMTLDNAEVAKATHLPDFNLCTAKCNSYCAKPLLHGGPDPEGESLSLPRDAGTLNKVTDCRTLASYYADGGRFNIDWRKYIIWEYGTCRVTQYNRLDCAKQRISYCFDQNHWAGVVDHLSSHCGPKSESHGGTCYFYDSLHFSTITLEKAS